jgi:hypothetical protein
VRDYSEKNNISWNGAVCQIKENNLYKPLDKKRQKEEEKKKDKILSGKILLRSISAFKKRYLEIKSYNDFDYVKSAFINSSKEFLSFWKIGVFNYLFYYTISNARGAPTMATRGSTTVCTCKGKTRPPPASHCIFSLKNYRGTTHTHPCDVRLQLFCGLRDSSSGRASKAPTQISAVFPNPSEARADTKSGFDQNAGIWHVLTPSPGRYSRSLYFWPGNYPLLISCKLCKSRW